jgi:hypothetical protein
MPLDQHKAYYESSDGNPLKLKPHRKYYRKSPYKNNKNQNKNHSHNHNHKDYENESDSGCETLDSEDSFTSYSTESSENSEDRDFIDDSEQSRDAELYLKSVKEFHSKRRK